MRFFVTNKRCSLFTILLYIQSLYSVSNAKVCFPDKEWTIHIYNAIKNSTLGLHVKSKEDDLGFHTVTYDVEYKFGFCANFFNRTLFWGVFSNGNKTATFDVFNLDIANLIGGEVGKNNHVYWALKEDGRYISKKWAPYDDPIWAYVGDWS
ncbi:S-protein homolog 5-like [Rutidosis leptorrhynchoides]|uniref:S-protein homolog 5-like n=1 Tax=Rutidosis leptorrhynchoides TaxID=125765 RepID=UPI003A99ACF9